MLNARMQTSLMGPCFCQGQQLVLEGVEPSPNPLLASARCLQVTNTLAPCSPTSLSPTPHLQVPEHRVVFYSWEQNPHGVGSVVQEGDPGSVQVTGQFMDVRLQLGKSWNEDRPVGRLAGTAQEPPPPESPQPSPRAQRSREQRLPRCGSDTTRCASSSWGECG